MANSQLYEKRWKYVSIGLMAVLALGFSFPQAFAHVTSDMKHGLEHVIALLTDIQTKVTGIKSTVDTNLDAKVSSRATQTSVNSLQSDVDALQSAVAGIGSGGSGSNCVTIDVNRDATLDRFEISPRPHVGVNYAGCDLFGADISGISLDGGNLSNADLSNADLSDADNANVLFSGADLSGADLSGSDLTGANMDGAILTGTIFTGCVGDPAGTPSAGTLPDCA
jgi:hypothetical protein